MRRRQEKIIWKWVLGQKANENCSRKTGEDQRKSFGNGGLVWNNASLIRIDNILLPPALGTPFAILTLHIHKVNQKIRILKLDLLFEA